MVRAFAAAGFTGGAADLRRGQLAGFWMAGPMRLEALTRSMVEGFARSGGVLGEGVLELAAGLDFNRGPMTANGIYQVDRPPRPPVPGGGLDPHRFRHSFHFHASTWLDRGGAEGDLMELKRPGLPADAAAGTAPAPAAPVPAAPMTA